LLWCCAAATAATIAEIARIDALLSVLDQRLRIAEQVARAKWNSGSPVEDLEREGKVKASFASQAASAGLDGVWAQQVMAAQIEASKIRQRQLIAQWTSERRPPFARPPDLARDVRPQLDRLESDLIAALVGARPVLDQDPTLLAWRVQVRWGARPDPARIRAVFPLRADTPETP
jgi:chorismate mutase